jgi:DNA-nicking Smr family endonuclease
LLREYAMNDDDNSEFAGMISGVRRLRQDRVNVYRQPGGKNSPPRKDEQPGLEQAVTAAASAGSRDSHFNSGLQRKLQRRIRQGLIRPEASLDLHGCRQREALRALEDFLGEATRRGLRMIIVVHGQGYRSQTDAVLKPLVQRWLAGQPQVLAWCPAQPRDGAAGASYVYLRVD